MFVDILQNAALLSIAAIGTYWVFQRRNFAESTTGSIALGLAYGLICFLVTVTPVTLDNGATIDARAGPVIVAGILGGPIAALIAAFLGGLGRFAVGGSFVFSGVIVYILYGCVGSVIYRKWLQSILGDDLHWRRVGVGIVLSIGSAALMYFLIAPQEMAFAWITEDFPWIALANGFSIALSAFFATVAVYAAAQQQKLTETLQTLELAKKSGGIGVWVYDVEKDAVSWDSTNKRLHGIKKVEETGRFKDWQNVVHPDDLKHATQSFFQTLENDALFDTQYRVLLPDGKVRTLKANALVQRDSRGKAIRVVGANFDLTPILERENELQETKSIAIHSQKLDIIGKLSGGVAHDFNNLLAVIQGNLEFLLRDSTTNELPADERMDILTSAISATRRGAELTRSMLAFARKSRLDPQPVNLNNIVRETENWIVRAIPSTIKIDTSLQHAVWPLMLDLSSLQSALINVIVNARDAMPKGGKLTIETLNLRIDEEYIRMLEEEVPKGRYVMLAVTDTGTGIDPSLLPTVFEPFVSSKPMSLGSGLGLSMVEGFARQSGGFVRIYSEMGIGTCVKMFFPVSPDADIAETTASPESKPASANPVKGRILVAEDQIEVLAVVVRTLKSAGYHVDAAPNGDQALQMFKEGAPYDLLLTDVVMPGELLGPKLAQACRDLQPDLPVVFMSGYASEATVHGNGLRAEDVRLMKPVPQSELLHTIQTSLENAAKAKE